ncbi:hypothetical protein [Brevibacillus centrosporus]|uniref:hypothetical protein n=1 Tax=Brevibacillus centrosporus TaxID=54910 RepID=UPI003986E6F5
MRVGDAFHSFVHTLSNGKEPAFLEAKTAAFSLTSGWRGARHAAAELCQRIQATRRQSRDPQLARARFGQVACGTDRQLEI